MVPNSGDRGRWISVSVCSRAARATSQTLSQKEDEKKKKGVLIKNITVLLKFNVKLTKMPLLVFPSRFAGEMIDTWVFYLF